MKVIIPMLMLIIAIVGLIVAIEDTKQEKKYQDTVIDNIHSGKTDNKPNPIIPDKRVNPRPPGSSNTSEITPEKLLIGIQGLISDSNRVQHIRNYEDSVTDNIQLSMITKILNEFTSDSDRLRALRLLKYKISKEYSGKDLRAFTNVFTSSSSKTEAMRLLK